MKSEKYVKKQRVIELIQSGNKIKYSLNESFG